MTYGWMLLVVAIVGGAIFSTVQNPEYDVTVDGYLTHDGERAELGYVEVHSVPKMGNCHSMLDASSSNEKGEISFQFEASNTAEFQICSAYDTRLNDSKPLIASESLRLPVLMEDVENGETQYPTEGYDIVVEDVTVEPVVR